MLKNIKILVKAMIVIKRKKYKPYEEISGELKNIKPPMFHRDIEKGEEEKAWLC